MNKHLLFISALFLFSVVCLGCQDDTNTNKLGFRVFGEGMVSLQHNVEPGDHLRTEIDLITFGDLTMTVKSNTVSGEDMEDENFVIKSELSTSYEDIVLPWCYNYDNGNLTVLLHECDEDFLPVNAYDYLSIDVTNNDTESHRYTIMLEMTNDL